MINKIDDFEIKYWAGDNNFLEESQKPKRSIKRKLTIVFSFIFVLIATPSIIFALSNLQSNRSEKVSQAPIEAFENKKTVNQNTVNPTKTPEPEKPIYVEVINNDSYWKIAKRACGSGRYYLSIRNQNNGKALFRGDVVSVACVY
jgi:hypothetical protein